jgi:hypothetical protein
MRGEKEEKEVGEKRERRLKGKAKVEHKKEEEEE